jgi:PAS domain S-box-containing protein
VSTLLVLIGGVIAIGAVLQLAVFPMLKGDSLVIENIKVIHLVASVLVIGLCWISIEIISKKITLPLRELTLRADQISRDAGKGTKTEGEPGSAPDDRRGSVPYPGPPPGNGDEIVQLKLSFYRMLAHLKASEARLRKSEEKYKFLFNNGPNPLFVVDSQGGAILDVNNRALEVYQYSRKELLNMRFQELASASDRTETERLLKRIMDSHILEPPTLRHRRKDGSSLLTYLQPHISWMGDRPAIIVAVWDVTEKLEQEAKMAQTGKMATLGEMATGIAHELNQPLNVIGLASNFLKKGLDREQAPSRKDLEYISSELTANVRRASIIINHLRQFGHSAEEAMGPININRPIMGMKTLLGAQLQKRGVQLEFDLSDDMPSISGNENRLEQVLINLALNARDAMLSEDEKAEGAHEDRLKNKLLIRSFVENGFAVVVVADSGPGVPDSIKQKIFDPFFTTKKLGEGTGIGLSISYGIIKEHKGIIEVSDREGGGAEFKVSLPLISRNPEIHNG